jgi:hypothetical protein
MCATASFRFLTLSCIALCVSSMAQSKPRARDLGVPFDGKPGPFNAITDVKGVEVGHTTLISGKGKLRSYRRNRSSPAGACFERPCVCGMVHHEW